MIARAALGKPWLFSQCAAALRGEPIPPDPTLDEERALLLHHYQLVCHRFGDDRGTVLMRKFACCYAQGRRGAATSAPPSPVFAPPPNSSPPSSNSFPANLLAVQS